MIPFREHNPKRRPNPTHSPVGNNWGQHKPDLKEDFKAYCGYCNSYDGFRHTYFEVDHFVPKDFLKKNGFPITLTQYSNLVYSCKFCNNKKLDKWPSQSATKYNNGSKGFIDPVNKEYADQFYRTPKGAIRGKTKLGEWMESKAFKFDERERSIIVLWNLNRLRLSIDGLIEELSKVPNGSKDYKSIKEKLIKYTLEYYIFDKELMGFYK